jgi:hypothetical protein
MMRKRALSTVPKTDLRKLSSRCHTVLWNEFGKLPTPEEVRVRAEASPLGKFRWLWSLRGAGRQTAEKLAEWAGIEIP